METRPSRHSMMMAQVPQAMRIVRPLDEDVKAWTLLLPYEGSNFAAPGTRHSIGTHREASAQRPCVVFFLQT